MSTLISPKQIFQENQVLTVAVADSLKGQKIACTNPEYSANSCHVSMFVVGEIINELEYMYTQEYPLQKEGFTQHKTFGHYWESYMSAAQLDEVKTTLVLLDDAGKKQFKAHTKYSNFYNTPTFTGSDADREVYYIKM